MNGVLRNIARNIDSISYPKKEENKIAYLSIRYSLPEWIVEDWMKTYGFEQTEEMAQTFLTQTKLPYLTCRITQLRNIIKDDIYIVPLYGVLQNISINLCTVCLCNQLYGMTCIRPPLPMTPA